MTKEEKKPVKFYLKDGTLFASNYSRVVIGEKGTYIEFDAEDIILTLITKPGQEFRGKGKYVFCKYYWLCPVGHETVKVYHQIQTVTYADYIPGKFYVRPEDLLWSKKILLYAEQGNQPKERNPTIFENPRTSKEKT